jgi:hypothetical protein
LRFWVFPKRIFFSVFHFFRPFFRPIFRWGIAIQKLFFALLILSTDKFIEWKKLGYVCIIYRKNRFLNFFIYKFIRVHLSARITLRGYIRSESCKFFCILHSRIKNTCFVLFSFRPYFEIFLTLKLKVPKRSFGTAISKPY